MSVQEVDFQESLNIFSSLTGIIPLESHISSMKNYIEKRLEQLKIQGNKKEFSTLIRSDKKELELFINSSTVNETYFFREQNHFAFLKNIFLQWQNKNGSKPILLWSAACSNGEEAYSLALLSNSLHIKCKITASDINTDSLKKVCSGEYSKKSLKTFDGNMFHTLLEPYYDQEKIVFPNEIKQMICVKNINLCSLIQPENSIVKSSEIEKQDVIFIRNVFIYFSAELKKQILHAITKNFLNDGGIIFVSMSEIASIDKTLVPKNLKKKCFENVYYFHQHHFQILRS